MEITTLAGGCFWCIEAVFSRLKGVEKTESGYSGGKDSLANYDTVSDGDTGHAEAVQITFDPAVISFQTLLDVFWKLHDPTTLNRQGADIGTQYRSVIFYHSLLQKKIAEESKSSLEKSKIYKDPIVTEIVPFKSFHKAKDYHQNYYETNKSNQYCQIVIDPKITKLYKEFKPLIRQDKSNLKE